MPLPTPPEDTLGLGEGTVVEVDEEVALGLDAEERAVGVRVLQVPVTDTLRESVGEAVREGDFEGEREVHGDGV